MDDVACAKEPPTHRLESRIESAPLEHLLLVLPKVLMVGVNALAILVNNCREDDYDHKHTRSARKMDSPPSSQQQQMYNSKRHRLCDSSQVQQPSTTAECNITVQQPSTAVSALVHVTTSTAGQSGRTSRSLSHTQTQERPTAASHQTRRLGGRRQLACTALL